jgi:hypothetical protein
MTFPNHGQDFTPPAILQGSPCWDCGAEVLGFVDNKIV